MIPCLENAQPRIIVRIGVSHLKQEITNHLSESVDGLGEFAALFTLTDNAIRVLAGRKESNDAKEKAVMALMAIEWTADQTRAVGSKRLSRLLRAQRGKHFPSCDYEMPNYMLMCDTDESVPIRHTQWVVRHRAIPRFQLFEISHIRSRAGLVARFDIRGARSPDCLAMFPFSQLMAAEWEIPIRT